MKIYTKYPSGITKIIKEKEFYQTEDLSNTITVYVDRTNLTDIVYTLTLEFLRADGRKTTLIEVPPVSGEDTALIEDDITYDIHNFILTETQLAVAGTLSFTCYITIFNNGVMVSRGALFNAINNVRKTVAYSMNTILVIENNEDDVPVIVADMKNAIDNLNGQLAGKVNTVDIVDDLTHTDSDKVLSANQGKVLNDAKADKTNASQSILAGTVQTNTKLITARTQPTSDNGYYELFGANSVNDYSIFKKYGAPNKDSSNWDHNSTNKVPFIQLSDDTYHSAGKDNTSGLGLGISTTNSIKPDIQIIPASRYAQNFSSYADNPLAPLIMFRPGFIFSPKGRVYDIDNSPHVYFGYNTDAYDSTKKSVHLQAHSTSFDVNTKGVELNGTGLHFYENGNQMATQTYVDSTTGHTIELSLDSTNYKITAVLKNSSGTVISTSSPIDLPLESVVVSGAYDDTTKKVVLTLQNGSTIDFSVADLISGLQTEITAQNKLSSDLVDDTNGLNKFVSASEKAQIGTNTADIAELKASKVVNKTYSELATMKSNGTLVAGQLYRITDYVTKTNGKCNNVSNDARSMEHPFDIIVSAISNNKFNENAKAILHNGDTYFANSNLTSWQLWYCFDNDDVRFEWADTTNGKGVIYRMIDEFGNDLPYDFKNIQFKRYKITATTDTRHSNAIGKYYGFNGNYNCTSDNLDFEWYYTFSKRSSGSDNGNDLSLAQTLAADYSNSYYVKEVVIAEYLTDSPNYRGCQALNNIVFQCENIIVNVQLGVGSHHNTFIGNKDITYVYFKEMCRNNIIQGEMSHARADECFEQNMIGDFITYINYSICWNKFSHHFARNTAIHMESNDFEAQVSDCKLPENFTRNHIFNMWGNVNASTHDTFNKCELGYMFNVTLSGAGTWDGVYSIALSNVTIKITNFFGSRLGRMEYVTISEEANSFNILNLTIGAIYGSSSLPLIIGLTALSSYQLATAYEKKIDFAFDTLLDKKELIYTWAQYSTGNSIIDYGGMKGIISTVAGTVSWSELDSIAAKIEEVRSGLFNITMSKSNPVGTGSISMNSGTASGMNSYANGSGATASGNFSTAIGFGVTASGSNAVAIGGSATANDAMAHGNMAQATAEGAHALGSGARAKGANQTVIGKFNISDTTSLEIVGNGGYYSENNARLLDANGDEYLAGDIYVNTTFTKDSNKDLVSKTGTKLVPVTANPTLDGTESDLTGLEVNGVKYKVPSTGGGGSLYRHRIYEKSANSMILEFIIIDSNETPYTETTILTFLEENSSEAVPYSANGRYKQGDNEYQILGVYIYNNVSYPFGIEYIVDVNTVNKTGFPSFTRFTDTVTQIL